MKNKKNLFIVILILTLILSLAGCNINSLEEYKRAAEKTNDIKKGQTSGDFTMVIDFNTENMTAEEIKELNYYKDMKMNFSASYDDVEEKGIYRNYLNFGGLGFDFDLYINGDEMFIKLPVVGKYMRAEDMRQFSPTESFENKKIISKETQEAVAKKWINLMNKEDVFKGKDIVLTTPDGEVKTSEYTITLTDEQIKSLFTDTVNIASEDENLRAFYDEMKKEVKFLEDKTYEEVIADWKQWIDNYYVENFKYTAYVDIDGYIVNEIIDIKFKVSNGIDEDIIGVDYTFNMKNWDINKEQNFTFPVLKDENTIKMDDIESTVFFEDIFK